MARLSKKSISGKQLRAQVLAYIENQQGKSLNYHSVAGALGYAKSHLREVAMAMAELAFDGELKETSPGMYKAIDRTKEAIGTFVRRSNGKNSVITDEDGLTISVPDAKSKHALNGDKVRVSISKPRRNGEEAKATVVEIIEKKDQVFVGTLQVDKHFAYLLTDSKYLGADIFIPRAKLMDGQTGDKAIARITDWAADQKNPRGEIVDLLGKTGENTAEIHAILAEYGLPYKYPEAVEKAANRIKPGITPAEVAKRLDMRGVTTFTIDPKDAKDFDDALSIRKLDNGNYEVGVHIADVTHYVRPGTIIDQEAEERATSVYLVDRVVPMLPERLCNEICSLRPDEDKLTFSCIFEITPDAKVVNHKICRTVTHSVRRFTYEEAQEVIETGKGDFAEELAILNGLAVKLRDERYENGSVDFDRVEVRFDIDKDGRPVGVFFKEAKEANKLIEEFMLLANRTVAAYVGNVGPKKQPKPFVYRIHDMPDPTKLEDLASLSSTFGYKVRSTGSAKEVNKSINKMLTEVKGKGEENFLSTLAIRSMAKAIYSTENIGHYGLGFEYYTHFTSPIRRYPDMMVHRLLDKYLNGGRGVDRDKLEDECKHSSDMEQLAANAERASIKYKQVEYLAERIGQVYDGIITGVTEWGIYVELNDNKCEGLVPIRELADDYYDYDERNYCLIGRRHAKRYRLGDVVKVEVIRANLDRKQIDFALIEDAGQADRRAAFEEQVHADYVETRSEPKPKKAKAEPKPKKASEAAKPKKAKAPAKKRSGNPKK